MTPNTARKQMLPIGIKTNYPRNPSSYSSEYLANIQLISPVNCEILQPELRDAYEQKTMREAIN